MIEWPAIENRFFLYYFISIKYKKGNKIKVAITENETSPQHPRQR